MEKSITFVMLPERLEYVKSEIKSDRLKAEPITGESNLMRVTIDNFDSMDLLSIYAAGVRYGINAMYSRLK
jgi:hypothetical protein